MTKSVYSQFGINDFDNCQHLIPLLKVKLIILILILFLLVLSISWQRYTSAEMYKIKKRYFCV